MISPSSPRVQVTRVTPAPSAAYLAIVAPVPMDSSSGWACTSSTLRPSRWLMALSLAAAHHCRAGRISAMADTFPRQQARTQRFTLGAPRSFQVSPDGSRVVFLRSKSGTDPVSCLWLLDVETGQEHLVADPALII